MVDLLDSHNEAGLIRLSYWVRGLSGTCTNYVLPRLNSTDYLWIRLIREWTLDNPWQTDDYLYSMQPHIAHMRYFEAYGYYAEHLHPGDTEIEACRQYNDSPLAENGPQILYPVGRQFVHVPYRHLARRQSDYLEVAGDIPAPDTEECERI